MLQEAGYWYLEDKDNPEASYWILCLWMTDVAYHVHYRGTEEDEVEEIDRHAR